MGHVDGVVRVHQQGDVVIHLFLIGVIELLKGSHVLHGPGLYADLLTLVPAVGEHQLQGAAHVVESRVMPAFRLPGLLGLHAADDIVIPGVLQGKASAQQRRDNDFIIVVRRQADARPRQICRLQQQLVGRLVPHPDGKGWLGQEHMLGGRDAHKAQVIRHI